MKKIAVIMHKEKLKQVVCLMKFNNYTMIIVLIKKYIDNKPCLD